MSSIVLKAALGVAVIMAARTSAHAQTQHPHPYSGFQMRQIKSLSDDQMADLTAGRGMALALPAELNGYPGPRHVLDLAGQLALTGEQHAGIESLFQSMRSEAVPIGRQLIDAEKELDRDFVARTITPERLKAATDVIGRLRGELRNTHMKYHLATAELLNSEQIRRYSELRGYAESAPSATHPQMHQHTIRR